MDRKFAQTLDAKIKSRNESLLINSLADFNKSEVVSSASKVKSVSRQNQNQNEFNNSTCLANESWCQASDESFLEMERKCNMEATINCSHASSVNETMLFDVDPPSEFWNQTINPSLADKTSPESIDISKSLIGWRPSTIIEETSSQMTSLNKDSDASTTSKSNETSKVVNSDRKERRKSSGSKSELGDLDEMFKATKRKYKFFADEMVATPTPKSHFKENTQLKNKLDNNLSSPSRSKFATPVIIKFDTPVNGKLNTPRRISVDTPVKTKIFTPNTPNSDDDNQMTPSDKRHCNGLRKRENFNDTLEAVNFFIEEGQRQEDLKNNVSIAATPLFSCKRTKILNQFAAEQMAAFPRRGPLINLMPSPNVGKTPADKTN